MIWRIENAPAEEGKSGTHSALRWGQGRSISPSPLFCEVDNATYGGLRKLGFARTQTLGYGGDCCDFHFFKK